MGIPLSKQNACQVLNTRRTTRSNTDLFEEIRQPPNFQRECQEETCNVEELYEIAGRDEDLLINYYMKLCERCDSDDVDQRCDEIGTKSCVNFYNSKRCICKQGFEGKRCEVRTQEENSDSPDEDEDNFDDKEIVVTTIYSPITTVPSTTTEVLIPATQLPPTELTPLQAHLTNLNTPCQDKTPKICQSNKQTQPPCQFLLQCIINHEPGIIDILELLEKKNFSFNFYYETCQYSCAVARLEYLLGGSTNEICKDVLEYDIDDSTFRVLGVTQENEKPTWYNFFNLESKECQPIYETKNKTLPHYGLKINNPKRSKYKIAEIYNPKLLNQAYRQKMKLLLYVFHIVIAVLLILALGWIFMTQKMAEKAELAKNGRKSSSGYQKGVRSSA